MTLDRARKLAFEHVENLFQENGLIEKGMQLELIVRVVSDDRIDPTTLEHMKPEDVFALLRQKCGNQSQFSTKYEVDYDTLRRMFSKKRVPVPEAEKIESITGIPVEKAGITIVQPRGRILELVAERKRHFASQQ